MRSCNRCGKALDVRYKALTCRDCFSVCTCGKAKDYRAAECQSCGNSRKAKVQWQEQRGTILAGIREAGKLRRYYLGDLSWDTKWQQRKDGRYWTWYWDGDTKHTIYRYQWLWQSVKGPIPKGYVVHHVNEDCSDDRLENLELKTGRRHRVDHGTAKLNEARWHGQKQPTHACLWCGRQFKHSLRKRANGYHYPLYCSLKCWTTARKEGQARADALALYRD
jgi:hypothetical protein